MGSYRSIVGRGSIQVITSDWANEASCAAITSNVILTYFNFVLGARVKEAMVIAVCGIVAPIQAPMPGSP